ncbi:MAG: hypothetical protein E6936_10765 [Clostridium perfringens]|uniref:hypothetical protein n=1 Tax=Clostridium perfringens TaxID=1502 RepID=UPI001FAFC010|nr:hypothetical protein [Clostridium perfringens]EHK2442851.1 hypothetical protein [Clostridium perfringens]MDK0751017.1 hypothetical protein [Clostridium perfringens]MDK0796653.1 hypothetical protein [Clostridium perfringens]MDM0889272.1 hypothetical protein [Clostridium perfringens]MDM0901109.1 hypothetical protein [Clostridium perfringens]
MRGKENYTRALIIVHGKSEKQICEYIKQNLRLNIEIKADKNGEKSIQVTSIMNTLKDTQHKTLSDFYNTYPGINVTGRGNKRVINDFKIFIMLDLDDCKESEGKAFKDKSMFRKHWAYDYIIPIYNEKDLEDSLKASGVKYTKKKSKDMKKEYIKIFPTDKRYKEKSDKIQLEEFAEMIRNSKKTNMSDLIDYCISCTKNK